MGATRRLPGGLAVDRRQRRDALRGRWGFDVPATPGLTAPRDDRRRRARRARRAVLGRGQLSRGTARTPCRSSGRWRADPTARPHGHRGRRPDARGPRGRGGPAARRHPLRDARRRDRDRAPSAAIIFSPEIPGPRIAEARPEWQVWGTSRRGPGRELADRVRFTGTAQIRPEIARSCPATRGIETLPAQGDSVQYGGPHLCCRRSFPTPDGKGPLHDRDASRRRSPTTGDPRSRRVAASSSTAWSRDAR